jgi:hypothetical protein
MTTVNLTSNFFKSTRGLTIADGGGITWAFNKNTNTLSASGSGGGGGSPYTTPQVFEPSSGVPITINCPNAGNQPTLGLVIATTTAGDAPYVLWSNITTPVGFVGSAQEDNQLCIGSISDDFIVGSIGGSLLLTAESNTRYNLKITAAGAVTIPGTLNWNGAAAAAQPTGYGTPTGGALISSFAAGSMTLGQVAAELAQLVVDLKTSGIIGA